MSSEGDNVLLRLNFSNSNVAIVTSTGEVSDSCDLLYGYRFVFLLLVTKNT